MIIGAIRSELRKLFSVRSTYVLTGLALLMTIFVTGYAHGYALKGGSPTDPNFLSEQTLQALGNIPTIFGSIVALLLITHEYRYNTILYTLTRSSRRGKVLLAKIIAVSLYALALTIAIGILAPLAALAGLHLKGAHLATQVIPYSSLVWRSLYYGWTALLAALLIGVLVRSQVGAIVTLFIIPTVEIMLGNLIKAKDVYLPFTGASSAILTHPPASSGYLSYGRAAIVFGLYLVVSWAVAWVLFLKRDAN